MESAKRVRSMNFTYNEMDILLTLVEEHKKTIECKKTDAATNREKDAEWERITQQFNSSVSTGRTTKQLRTKWEAWKKTTRKKISLYKTSGGIGDSALSNWEERILNIVGISALGIDSKFDSNNASQINTNGDTPSRSIEDVQDIIVDCDNSIENDFTAVLPVMQLDQNLLIEESVENKDNKENINDTWKHWSASQLTKPVHIALSANISEEDAALPCTPVHTIQKESAATVQKSRRKRKYQDVSCTIFNKYEQLLDKKLELASLQIDLLKKEHEMKEKRNGEKHELEMQVLKSKCTCRQNV